MAWTAKCGCIDAVRAGSGQPGTSFGKCPINVLHDGASGNSVPQRSIFVCRLPLRWLVAVGST